MGENDSVEILDWKREAAVLLGRFLTLALKHPAVESDCMSIDVQEVAGTGDLTGGTGKYKGITGTEAFACVTVDTPETLKLAKQYAVAEQDAEHGRRGAMTSPDFNDELAAARQVVVEFLGREAADADPALIRTAANLIPREIDPLRVIDIVGLDKQADGGTHVASTAEVGAVRVTGTESKGKGNKRVRIEVVEAAATP